MSRKSNIPSSRTAREPWSTSEGVSLLSDIDTGVAGTEEQEKTSPASWSTSATLPVSPEYEIHGHPKELEATGGPKEENKSPQYDRTSSPTSPKSPASRKSWSSSEDGAEGVGLLSDVEETTTGEEEKTSEEAPKEEEKKSFSSAENKIAFSHFLVRSNHSAFRSLLTKSRGSFHIPPGLIKYFSLLLHLLQYVPV